MMTVAGIRDSSPPIARESPATLLTVTVAPDQWIYLKIKHQTASVRHRAAISLDGATAYWLGDGFARASCGVNIDDGAVVRDGTLRRAPFCGRHQAAA